MNERIRELAEQAGVYFGKATEDYFGEWHPAFTNTEDIDFEKFAELIVRECISVMKSTVDESIDFDRKLDETSSWIESDIKQHFGVNDETGELE